MSAYRAFVGASWLLALTLLAPAVAAQPGNTPPAGEEGTAQPEEPLPPDDGQPELEPPVGDGQPGDGQPEAQPEGGDGQPSADGTPDGAEAPGAGKPLPGGVSTTQPPAPGRIRFGPERAPLSQEDSEVLGQAERDFLRFQQAAEEHHRRIRGF